MGIDGGITSYFISKSPCFLARPLFNSFKLANNYSFEEYHQKAKSSKIIHHELLDNIPFKNNSVDNIYSSHFLEHLCENDAQKLISECFRTLKPSGILRIVVPSLDIEVQNLRDSIKEYDRGNYKPIQKYVTSNIFGYQDKYSNHKYMYNFSILGNILEVTGFKNIKECQFKKGKIPDVQLLDTRKNSLFIEAEKL